MTQCIFQRADGGVTCELCGRFVRTTNPPQRVHATCREPEPPFVHERKLHCLTCGHRMNSHRCKLVDLGCARTYRRLLYDPTGVCPIGNWPSPQTEQHV